MHTFPSFSMRTFIWNDLSSLRYPYYTRQSARHWLQYNFSHRSVTDVQKYPFWWYYQLFRICIHTGHCAGYILLWWNGAWGYSQSIWMQSSLIRKYKQKLKNPMNFLFIFLFEISTKLVIRPFTSLNEETSFHHISIQMPFRIYTYIHKFGNVNFHFKFPIFPSFVTFHLNFICQKKTTNSHSWYSPSPCWGWWVVAVCSDVPVENFRSRLYTNKINLSMKRPRAKRHGVSYIQRKKNVINNKENSQINTIPKSK